MARNKSHRIGECTDSQGETLDFIINQACYKYIYVDFKERFGGNRGDLQSIDKTGAVLRRLIQEVGKRPKPKFIRPKESTGLESK